MLQVGLTRARAAWRVALALWGLGLVAALPVGLLTERVVGGFFGPRLAADAVAARLEPLYAADLFFSEPASMAAFAPLVLGICALWAALAPLRHGLALSGAADASGGVWARAGARFWPLARLAPMVWGLSAALLGLSGAALAKLGGAGLEPWTSEKGVFAARLAMLFVLLLLAGWLRGAAELMRARVVVDEEPLARRAFAAGLGEALRRPGRALAPAALFGGVGLLLTLAVSLLDARVARTGWGLFALGLALQQLTALGRAGLTVALSGAVLSTRRGPEAG